jgi:zinc transporter
MENGGLICAWMFDGNGGGQALNWEQTKAAQPAAGQTLWIHLDYSVPVVQDWLYRQSGLSELTVAALVQLETRPRVVPADHGLMAFLRGVNLNPGAEPDDMVSVRLWVGERRIISLRQRRLMSIDDLRTALGADRGPRNGGEFLAMLVDGLLDRIDHVVETIYENIDTLEEPHQLTSIPVQRRQLSEIRRQAIALRRFLAPQREALHRLAADTSPILSELDRLQLREEYDRQTRIVEDLDAARERAAVGQESLASQMAEQTNQRMFLLSIIAAIFLPLSFLTGLLGINVGGIPGAENPSAFVLVVIGLLIVGAALWFYFRSRNWV